MPWKSRGQVCRSVLAGCGAVAVTLAGPVIVSATAAPAAAPASECTAGYVCAIPESALTTYPGGRPLTSEPARAFRAGAAIARPALLPMPLTGPVPGEIEEPEPVGGYVVEPVPAGIYGELLSAVGNGDWVSAGSVVRESSAVGLHLCVYVPQQADIDAPDQTDSRAETSMPVEAMAFGLSQESVSTPLIVGIGLGSCP
jgi:hypothetical protein